MHHTPNWCSVGDYFNLHFEQNNPFEKEQQLKTQNVMNGVFNVHNKQLVNLLI